MLAPPGELALNLQCTRRHVRRDVTYRHAPRMISWVIEVIAGRAQRLEERQPTWSGHDLREQRRSRFRPFVEVPSSAAAASSASSSMSTRVRVTISSDIAERD